MPHKLSLESFGKKTKMMLSSTKTLIFSTMLGKFFTVRVVQSVLCQSALGAKKVPFSPNKNATYPQQSKIPKNFPGGSPFQIRTGMEIDRVLCTLIIFLI